MAGYTVKYVSDIKGGAETNYSSCAVVEIAGEAPQLIYVLKESEGAVIRYISADCVEEIWKA